MKKISLVFAVVLCLYGSALAAEWNFYGSARVSTFYTKFDYDPFASGAAALGLGLGANTTKYEESLYGNSRVGAKVQVSDTLKGAFEYGALGGNVNLRILWGEWDFGGGKLGVGQNYTPLLFPYSNQVYNINGLNKGDTNMSYFGMLYGERKPQIRLTFGTLQIAAVQPVTLVYVTPVAGPAPALSQPVTSGTLPSIQAKYKFEFPHGHIALAGGYQNFEVRSAGLEHEVTSYVLGIGGQLDAGAFYLKGNIWGGQNVGNLANHLVNTKLWSTAPGTGNFGTGDLDGEGFGLAQWDGTKITDRDAMAYLAVIGYKIKRGLYLEAGCGYTTSTMDGPGTDRDDAVTYYLQSTIFLAEGIFLTPEIGGCDFKQTGQSVLSYAGIKWQINF